MDQGGRALHHGQVACSFCGKGQREVRKLIAGPNSICICDECIELCGEILVEERAGELVKELAAKQPNLVNPQVIFSLLIKACEADARVPRIISNLVGALAVALHKHLNPPES